MMVEYESYNNRCVRDLAWAIASPPLLYAQDDDVAWPDASWFLAAWEGMHERLSELDKNPVHLLEFCRKFCGKNTRLGRYFESLLAYWFSQDANYELLYHDVQIHVDGNTLGAFDFIVHDRKQDMTLHFEVAIKFYLGAGKNFWPGPNRKDSLERKYNHLVRGQSRLSFIPEVKEKLQEMGVAIDERLVIVKGRLFYPAVDHQCHPVQSATDHLQSEWWSQAEYYHRFESESWGWSVLEKSHWLSRIMSCDHLSPMNILQIKSYWHKKTLQWPCCLVAIGDDGDEIFRLFVVPEDWNV